MTVNKQRVDYEWQVFRDLELPTEDFAKGVRELCDRTGALLVVDDVRAGFRQDQSQTCWCELCEVLAGQLL